MLDFLVIGLVSTLALLVYRWLDREIISVVRDHNNNLKELVQTLGILMQQQAAAQSRSPAKVKKSETMGFAQKETKNAG